MVLFRCPATKVSRMHNLHIMNAHYQLIEKFAQIAQDMQDLLLMVFEYRCVDKIYCKCWRRSCLLAKKHTSYIQLAAGFNGWRTLEKVLGQCTSRRRLLVQERSSIRKHKQQPARQQQRQAYQQRRQTSSSTTDRYHSAIFQGYMDDVSQERQQFGIPRRRTSLYKWYTGCSSTTTTVSIRAKER